MSPIRRILVAVDFSPASNEALTSALKLARSVAAEVHVIHIVDNLALALAELPRYAYLRDLRAESEQVAREQIKSLVSSERVTSVRIQSEVVTAAAPATAIVEYARRADVDLIVMGTHGHGELGRLVLGSVADRVIRTASCPVLTIRNEEIGTEQHAYTITRILVPTDFGPASAAALGYAGELARATGARLELLHVVDDLAARYLEFPFSALGDVQMSVEESARRQLDELAAKEELRFSRPHTVLLTSTAPERAIAEYAKDERVDLIVMGTHGRGPVIRMFLGSVADRVVRSASCPVMTVRESKFASPSRKIADVHQSTSELST
jgi:nucleotide-binding universal stress UspA family protein